MMKQISRAMSTLAVVYLCMSIFWQPTDSQTIDNEYVVIDMVQNNPGVFIVLTNLKWLDDKHIIYFAVFDDWPSFS